MIQRYLVAKYAENLMRMEPKNIGVVVWANGDATAILTQRRSRIC